MLLSAGALWVFPFAIFTYYYRDRWCHGSQIHGLYNLICTFDQHGIDSATTMFYIIIGFIYQHILGSE